MYWRFLLFLPLLILSCCKTTQHDTPQLISQVSLESTVETALKSGYFDRGNWPEENWWVSFGDAELDRFIDMALAYNPGYLAAKSKVEKIEQEAKVVYAKLFPHLSFPGFFLWDYLRGDGNKLVAPATLNGMFLNFTYEFDFWGKNRSTFAAAIGEVNTQKALYAQSKLMLAAVVAEMYFTLQSAMEKEEIFSELLEEQTRMFCLVKAKNTYGLTSRIVLNDMKKKILQIQQKVTFVREEIALKKHALQMLTGQEVISCFTLPKRWDYKQDMFFLPDFLGSDLLARRPDITAKIWQVHAAAKRVGVAKTEFFPNIDLSTGIGLLNGKLGNLFERESLLGFLLPFFQWPLFTAGKLTANLRAKIADYEKAVHEYNDIVLHAVQEVSDQITIYRSVQERVEKEEQIEKCLESNVSLIRLRVERGLDPYIRFLSERGSYLEQKLKLVDLQRDQYLVVVQLIKSLGGGYFTHDSI